MEELAFDNILGENDINALFGDIEETTTTSESDDSKEEQKEEKEEKITEVSSADELFEEAEEPESVGNENNKEEKDTKSPKTGSPNTYSSIAKAFADEGIFPDLSEEEINNINSPEALRKAIDNQIKAGLDERQKRIESALNAGVQDPEIRKYEQTLNYLNNITDEILEEEGDKGDNLRKQLIYQDFLNRGYTKERATKMVERSFSAGTDIDDAKEALKSNRDFFQDEYNELINESKRAQEEAAREQTAQAEKLKNSILKDKSFFGDVEVDNNTRQKVYDNIFKPVYKDSETGEYITVLQKYQRENNLEFAKNVGLLFTLTDGFKSIDKLIKGKVKKEVGKGFKNLEHILNSTSRDSDGNLKFVSGISNDPESFLGKGIKLDL